MHWVAQNIATYRNTQVLLVDLCWFSSELKEQKQSPAAARFAKRSSASSLNTAPSCLSFKPFFIHVPTKSKRTLLLLPPPVKLWHFPVGLGIEFFFYFVRRYPVVLLNTSVCNIDCTSLRIILAWGWLSKNPKYVAKIYNINILYVILLSLNKTYHFIDRGFVLTKYSDIEFYPDKPLVTPCVTVVQCSLSLIFCYSHIIILRGYCVGINFSWFVFRGNLLRSYKFECNIQLCKTYNYLCHIFYLHVGIFCRKQNFTTKPTNCINLFYYK